ncbi:MAG: septum formation initiator family protein [Oscillospiraceae bacterium]|nr:septum formation initiator family protein [Oscillospiraceae bacterium]
MAENNRAYNFEPFEDKPRQPKPPQPPPNIEKVQPAKDKKGKPVQIAFLLLILLVLAGSMIYTRVELTEISAEISKSEKELDKLKDDNLRLNLAIDSSTSLKTIEEYAKENLGLVKLNRSQKKYYNLTSGNRIELFETSERGFFRTIKDWIDMIIDMIKDYIPSR